MPLYEYSCNDCGEQFELLVSRTTTPACPKCESLKLEKAFSTFSAKGGSSGSSTHGAGCGCCRSHEPNGDACCMN